MIEDEGEIGAGAESLEQWAAREHWTTQGRIRDPETERRLRELLRDLGEVIYRSLMSKTPVRSDEARDLINKHRDVPEFKSLAFTLILLAEGGNHRAAQTPGELS